MMVVLIIVAVLMIGCVITAGNLEGGWVSVKPDPAGAIDFAFHVTIIVT
jgi:hypothetical protein